MSKEKTLSLMTMIDTAGTITNAAQAIMDAGATEVYACGTHGVFSIRPLNELINPSLKQWWLPILFIFQKKNVWIKLIN